MVDRSATRASRSVTHVRCRISVRRRGFPDGPVTPIVQIGSNGYSSAPSAVPFSDMMRRLILPALCACFAACASNAPETNTKPETSVRVAGIDAPLARGDCKEAVRRAIEKPDLDV